MRLIVFCHSLLSDDNHGNGHFSRGVVTELVERGHEVSVLEPLDAWSARNLTIRARHTCAHRVDQLLSIIDEERR